MLVVPLLQLVIPARAWSLAARYTPYPRGNLRVSRAGNSGRARWRRRRCCTGVQGYFALLSLGLALCDASGPAEDPGMVQWLRIDDPVLSV